MAQVIKTVCVSTGSKNGYGYSVWRTVKCDEGQRGYRSERGVEVIWESQNLYRPTCGALHSKGYRAHQYALQVATVARLAMTTR